MIEDEDGRREGEAGAEGDVARATGPEPEAAIVADCDICVESGLWKDDDDDGRG